MNLKENKKEKGQKRKKATERKILLHGGQLILSYPYLIKKVPKRNNKFSSNCNKLYLKNITYCLINIVNDDS